MAAQNTTHRPGQAPISKPAENSERNLLQSIQMETAPEAAPLMMFFANNAKLLISCLGVFILVVIGFGIFNYTAQKALNASREELGGILQKQDQKEKSAALESFIAKAPKDAVTAAALALAQSYELQTEYAKAAEAWGKVSANATSPMREQAIISQAEALAASGEFNKALELAEKLLAQVKDNNNYQIPLNSMIADFAEHSGNNSRAAEACKAVLSAPKQDNLESREYWQSRLERLSTAK